MNNFNKKNILAIETSCDETAICYGIACGDINKCEFNVFSNFVISQINIHKEFGGVVPTLAKREHKKNLPIILENLKNDLKSKQIEFKPDEIVVTIGPGLPPALWTGLEFAKNLSIDLKVDLYGVNHLEGHLYAPFYDNQNIKLPALSLIISGGHTMIVLLKEDNSIELIGETCDDALGECYDKVARMIDLPYPGGPLIEKLALIGKPIIELPRPMMYTKELMMSFSGLKTACLYYLRDHKNDDNFNKEDFCASFEKSVIDVLVHKTQKALNNYYTKTLMVGGGVANNLNIRKALEDLSIKNNIEFKYSSTLNTDNALMILIASFLGRKYGVEEVNGSLGI